MSEFTDYREWAGSEIDSLRTKLSEVEREKNTLKLTSDYYFVQREELLDLIEELHGFLRHGTFDAVRGEGMAYRRGLATLARCGRAATTSSTNSTSRSVDSHEFP